MFYNSYGSEVLPMLRKVSSVFCKFSKLPAIFVFMLISAKCLYPKRCACSSLLPRISSKVTLAWTDLSW